MSDDELEQILDPKGVVQQEIELLEHYTSQGEYNYLARDECGTLELYTHKPIKDELLGLWLPSQGEHESIKSTLFRFIDFKAREGYELSVMLHGGKGEKL